MLPSEPKGLLPPLDQILPPLYEFGVLYKEIEGVHPDEWGNAREILKKAYSAAQELGDFGDPRYQNLARKARLCFKQFKPARKPHSQRRSNYTSQTMPIALALYSTRVPVEKADIADSIISLDPSLRASYLHSLTQKPKSLDFLVEPASS